MDVLTVFSLWPRPLRSWRVLAVLLLYRIALCLTLRTAESPDEWWQSEEVAYHMVFGHGHLTWEWHELIRSYVFPAIFACPLFVLKWTGTDTAMTVWAANRCVQAVIFFAQDCTMLALAQRLDDLRCGLDLSTSGRGAGSFSPSSAPSSSTKTAGGIPTIASTTLAMLVVEWFLNNTGVRGYSNVAESLFFLLSLYQARYSTFLLCAGAACAVRATAAIAVLPVFMVHIFRLCRRKGIARGLAVVAPLTVSALASVSAAVCLVDYVFYDRLVFTPYRFLKVNVLMGVSKYFGVHPPYWYFVVLPAMAAPFAFFLAWAPVCWKRMQVAEGRHVSGSTRYADHTLLTCTSSRTLRQEIKRWVFVGVLSLMLYSLVDHKEMRFVYFLLPILLVLSSVVVVDLCTSSLSAQKNSPSVQSVRWSLVVPSAATVRRLFTLCWVANVALTIVLLYGYRRGSPTLWRKIRDADWHFRHLEVLTHCYATPGFAQLHGKVDRLELVDCPVKLDPVLGVREVTHDLLFREQQKAYALWRYLRLPSKLDVEEVGMESEKKLSKGAWWRGAHHLMPAAEPPVLPDGIVLFQNTAISLEADLLRPMGYRRIAVVFHTPYNFEKDEDRYLELWSREVT
ncbi:Alg9-like mannosyltransferase family, putative [Leishmania lindenbergi]|uniref:Mannosyltransferase n=1 Tax=Leishmania lindenbergi TaxID=651832 RepID=A0AAW2ZUI9_9TRYP